MLYGEFQALTDDKCTYEEYEAINKIYMDCNWMSHQDAANLWFQSYGGMKQLLVGQDEKRFYLTLEDKKRILRQLGEYAIRVTDSFYIEKMMKHPEELEILPDILKILFAETGVAEQRAL